MIKDIKKDYRPQPYRTITQKVSKSNTSKIIYPREEFIDLLDREKENIIVLIQIEEFKYLNYSLHKKITKKIQKIFARNLLNHLPETCNFKNIYLLDNGEFVFIKPYTKELNKYYFECEIRKFQECINKTPVQIGLTSYTLSILISLSFGEYAFENAKIGLNRLMEKKQTFILSKKLLEEERTEALHKLQTLQMVKQALANYGIISYFQPIIDNKTQKIEKYESLVRLIDDRKNIISPYHFLDIAKECSYYQKITSAVLINSFKALHQTDKNISINLSFLDIEQENTQKEFFELLEQYKEDAHRIVIELLEDENIRDVQLIIQFITKIRKYKIQISIDDFGAGYSNFKRLMEYKPDYIKIDGSLIRNIEDDAFSQYMVETIVFFAQKQNIKTIAEHVENENIFNIVKKLGVDYSQGYYFGKPELLKCD